MLTQRKKKIPSTGGSEEVRTRDAASGRTESPTHYRLSYSGPDGCGVWAGPVLAAELTLDSVRENL